MTDERLTGDVLGGRDEGDPGDDSVVLRPNAFAAIARAVSSPSSLSLTSIVLATATLLSMSAANEIAEAKLYSSTGFNNLSLIRWASGTRLVIAGAALLIALLAGVLYSRSLPATRYTFIDGSQDPVESVVGEPPSTWIRLLVGAGVAISLLAVVINGVSLALTLHLHESPNFGTRLGG